MFGLALSELQLKAKFLLCKWIKIKIDFQRYWLGNNGKYYNKSWGGNQWTGSRSGAVKTAKLFSIAGKVTFAAQTAVSIAQAGVAVHNKDTNAWGVVGKSTLNIAMGVLTTWGGSIGLTIGSVYFIGDVFGLWGTWGEPAGTIKY